MESQYPTAQAAEPQTTEPTRKGDMTEKSFEQQQGIKVGSNEPSEKSRIDSSNSEAADAPEPAEEWLEGTKLFLVILSLIFGTFLMLLDTSIIATVSHFANTLQNGKFRGLGF